MITVVTKPQLYTSKNFAMFKITSDRDNILQFKVIVYDADTSDVITVQKYATLPMIANGTIFDLAPVLSSFVDYELDKSNTVLVPTLKVFRRYQVEIIELYRDDVDGNIYEGDDLYIDEDFFIFNGQVSRPDFLTWDFKRYVATSGYFFTRFLSLKPLINNTFYSDLQYLYFICQIPCYLEIRFYRRPGILIGTHREGADSFKAYRANVTPDALVAAYGDDLLNQLGEEFTDEFTEEFGSPPTIDQADYYKVHLVDLDSVSLSEERVYNLKGEPCKVDKVNIVFGNNLGGFDTMVFQEPREQLDTAKTTIVANPFQIDSDANYTGAVNGIFNPSNVTINSVETQTFSLVSLLLNDNERDFAKSLIASNDVFIQLKTGELYPIVLVETSFSVTKKKYTTDNVRLAISFKIVDTNLSL